MGNSLIRRIFFDNLGAKLMALGMATALWFYSVQRYTGEVTGTVPVEVVTPTGYAVLEQGAKETGVRLKGPKGVINYVAALINDNKVTVRHTVVIPESGSQDIYEETFLLGKKDFNLPPEIKVVSVNPNHLHVVVGRLEQRNVKVQLQKTGEPAPGYTITNEFFYPFEVKVTGPVSILKELSSINTVPVDLTNITSAQNPTFPWRVAVEQKLTIVKDNKTVTVPVTCDEKVSVWLEVRETLDKKTFERVKIKLLQPPDFPYKVKLQEEYVDLRVKGPKLVLDKLNPPEVYIDVSLLKPPGPYKQPLECTLPERVELEEKLPEVHLDIIDQQTEKKT